MPVSADQGLGKQPRVKARAGDGHQFKRPNGRPGVRGGTMVHVGSSIGRHSVGKQLLRFNPCL
jgi:hypothetical protein